MTDSKYLSAFDGWLRTLGEDVLSLANLLEASDAPVPFRQASAESLHYLLRSAELIPEGLEALGYLEGAFAFRVIAERALVEGAAKPAASEEPHPSDEVDHRAPAASDDEPTEDGTFAATAPGDGELTQDSTLERAESNAVEPADGSGLEPADGSGLEPADDRPFGASEGRAVVPSEGRVPRLAADVALIREFLGEEDMPRLFALALAPAATRRAGRAAAELLEDDALRGSTLRDARQWVERYRAPELRASNEELVKLRSFFRTRLRHEP